MAKPLNEEQLRQLNHLKHKWVRNFVRILHPDEVAFYYRRMWNAESPDKTDCIGEIVASRKIETPILGLMYTIRFADGEIGEFTQFQFEILYDETITAEVTGG